MDSEREHYDALCAGIATLDILLYGPDASLFTKDTVKAESFLMANGGDASNTAVSLAKLGMKTVLSACIGDDETGKILKGSLREKGVYTEGILTVEGAKTSTPVLIVDPLGERHIIRIPESANAHFSDTSVSDGLLKRSGHLHVGSANVLKSLDGKPLARLLKRAKSFGLSTSMDVSYNDSKDTLADIEEALYSCDIFLPSIQEASQISGKESLRDIVSFFMKYPLKVFGIKLGKDGVYLKEGDEEVSLPSLYEGSPVDTTGAGDAFFAGFLYGYLNGYDLRSCGLLGSSQATSVLSDKGAVTGVYDIHQNISLIERSGYTLQKKEEAE